MKFLPLLFAAALLAACASPAPTTDFSGFERHDWTCDEGRAFSIRFDGRDRAELFAGGGVHILTGGGATYSAGAVQYYEQSGRAQVGGAVGGPYANCVRAGS